MPSSFFQLPNGDEKNLCNRTWELHDFEDERVLNVGNEFAQDLWVSASGVYERYRKKSKSRQAEPEELSEMGNGLRDYYGQIMNSLENPSLDHEWVVYQMPQLWCVPEPPHQVFIGNSEQLAQYAHQSNKEAITSAYLRAKSLPPSITH